LIFECGLEIFEWYDTDNRSKLSSCPSSHHPGTLVSDWQTMSGLDVNALPELVIFDYIYLASE